MGARSCPTLPLFSPAGLSRVWVARASVHLNRSIAAPRERCRRGRAFRGPQISTRQTLLPARHYDGAGMPFKFWKKEEKKPAPPPPAKRGGPPAAKPPARVVEKPAPAPPAR